MAAGVKKYGGTWNTGDPVKIEMACIRKGGAWIGPEGNIIGEGLEHHYRALIKLLWPHWDWHKWSNLLIKEFVANWLTGVLGPASSGKTACGAVFALTDYFTFPNETTWLASSTNMEGLERRVWGEIKMRFKEAKSRYPWLPGHVVDSRRMLVTQQIDDDNQVRDVRCGIICVACLQGGKFVGLGNYVGVKNKRVRQMADELQFMPAGFVDAIANLSKNPDYKIIGFGNPNEQTDALGKLCEPADDKGWDGLEDTTKTQTWNTRYVHATRGCGRGIRLDGRDTPNADYPKGLNPYTYLITPEHIASDVAFRGGEDAKVAMFNYGKMPKNSQARRVITRNLCTSNGAFEDVLWDSSTPLINIGCLDAAYSGVGGDRTPFIHLKMGRELNGGWVLAFEGDPIIIPVSERGAEPCDQIAAFVKMQCEERGIEPFRFFFDGTGRSSLTSSLGRIWSPSVVPIEFGGKATNRPLGKIEDCSKKYKKMVSELWFASRHLIEGKQLRKLPNSVAEEGYLRAWKIFDGGFEDVETKDDMKIRLGRSPDLYDAFVCGIEGARRLGFRIAALNAVKKTVQNPISKFHAEYRQTIVSQQLEAA